MRHRQNRLETSNSAHAHSATLAEHILPSSTYVQASTLVSRLVSHPHHRLWCLTQCSQVQRQYRRLTHGIHGAPDTTKGSNGRLHSALRSLGWNLPSYMSRQRGRVQPRRIPSGAGSVREVDQLLQESIPKPCGYLLAGQEGGCSCWIQRPSTLLCCETADLNIDLSRRVNIHTLDTTPPAGMLQQPLGCHRRLTPVCPPPRLCPQRLRWRLPLPVPGRDCL